MVQLINNDITLMSVPEGQTRESFIQVKIKNIERTMEMFGCILDDNKNFDSDFQIAVIGLQLQLQEMRDRLKGKIL